MEITIDDFKKAAEERKITRWNIHGCSMCKYLCGFIIDGENVYYDAGCRCVGVPQIEMRSWEKLVEQYQFDSERNPHIMAEINKFWGFGRQCVGETDTNGIQIRIGDICTSGQIERPGVQYSIYWNEEKQKFSFGFNKYAGDLVFFQPLTIVGNIYDGVTRYDDRNEWLGYPELKGSETEC